MARVIPPMEQLRRLAVPLQAGELQVLDSLQALGDDWAIYVQPRLGLDQPDFVAVHPEHGAVVIEVRDWRPGTHRLSSAGVIEVRGTGGWERTDEAPRYVAHRTAVVVQERFFADTNDPPRDPSIRAIVVLVRQSAQEAQELVGTPRVTMSEERVRYFSGADLRADTLDALVGPPRIPRRAIAPRSLARLERHLDQAVAAAADSAAAGPDAAIDPALALVPGGLAAEVVQGPTASETRQVQVRAAAGSGKTTGLVARATELARARRDVLVVTGTAHHAVHLHGQILARCAALGADPRHVSCIHVLGLCARAADDARVAGFRRTSSIRRRVQLDAHELAERAVHAYEAGIGPRFDDVLVDQGEDLSALQWALLRLLVRRDEGELLLLTDPTQQLDGLSWHDPQGAELTGLLAGWLERHETHRLPTDLIDLVARFADSYLDEADLIEPTRPTGDGPPSTSSRRWVDVPPGAAVGKVLGDEVVRLLERHPDLTADDVLFVAPSHRAGTDATSVIRVAGHEVQHVFGSDSRDGQRRRERFRIGAPGVKGCTPAEAKGLDARAVVVAIPASRHGRVWGYIGLTRVRADAGRRSYITVVNQDVALRAFGRAFDAHRVEVPDTPATPPGSTSSAPSGVPAGAVARETGGTDPVAPVAPAPPLWRRGAHVVDGGVVSVSPPLGSPAAPSA